MILGISTADNCRKQRRKSQEDNHSTYLNSMMKDIDVNKIQNGTLWNSSSVIMEQKYCKSGCMSKIIEVDEEQDEIYENSGKMYLPSGHTTSIERTLFQR